MNIPKYDRRLEEALDRDNPLEGLGVFKEAVRSSVKVGENLAVRLYHSLLELGGGVYTHTGALELDYYLFRKR